MRGGYVPSHFGTTLIFIEISFNILLAIVSLCDIKTNKIPNEFVLIIFLLAIINLLSNNFTLRKIIEHTLFTIAFVSSLIIIRKITHNGIGFGDIKLLSATTLYYGIINSYVALFIASLLGIIFIFLTKNGNYHSRLKLPFAPFICIGYGFVSLLKRMAV